MDKSYLLKSKKILIVNYVNVKVTSKHLIQKSSQSIEYETIICQERWHET